MHNSKILLKVVCLCIIMSLIMKAFDFLTVPAQSSERVMMHELYNQENVDVICIGASSYKRGIDPWVLEEGLECSAFNMATVQQNIMTSYYYLKDVLENYNPRLVILDIGLNRLMAGSNSNANFLAYDYYRPSWNKVEYFFNVFTFDEYLKGLFPSLRSYNQENLKRPDVIKQNVKDKLTSEYQQFDYKFGNFAAANYVGKGFTQTYKVLRPEQNFPPSVYWNNSDAREEKLEYYKKCIELCKQYGVKILIADLPNKLSSFEVMQGYMDYHNYLEQLGQEWGAEVVDFGLVRSELFDRKKNEYYRDFKHLNTLGAKKFTQQVLVPFIKDFWEGSIDDAHYFYSSQDEMRDDNRFVYSVFLENGADKKEMIAKSTNGTGVVPEYEFLYANQKGGEYKVIRPYGTKAEIDISGYDSGYIRVNVRTLGSKESFEHYYRKEIGSE